MELTFYARPVDAAKWKIPTPVGNYIITQEESISCESVYWVQTPVGRRIETDAPSLDEAEQLVASHYHKHYSG